MTSDPQQAVIQDLTRPPGKRQITGQSPGGWQSVRVTGGPFATAEKDSIKFLKERSSGNRRLYAVSYSDEERHDHLDFVGVVQKPDGSWTRSGGAGGSGTGPERDRPWVNFGGWWGPNIFAAGGRVIGTNSEHAHRVELAFEDGTTLHDTVESQIVLFITELTLQPPATARIFDAAGNLLAEHAAFASASHRSH